MKILYATFRVEVSNEEYSYQSSTRGTAELKIQVPRTVLEAIDPGSLFVGTLQAALIDLDAPEDEGG